MNGPLVDGMVFGRWKGIAACLLHAEFTETSPSARGQGMNDCPHASVLCGSREHQMGR